MKLLHEVNWYARAMGRHATFSGRATRSEFWSFTLVSVVISLAAASLDEGLHTGGILNLLVLVVNALPSLFAKRSFAACLRCVTGRLDL